MDLPRKLYREVLVVVTLSLWVCLGASAQGPVAVSVKNQATATPTTNPLPPVASSTSDDTWHFDLGPYVFVPGIHGTVGVLGHDASVHVSGSDVLSNFNGGLAGFVQARKNRFVVPIDFIWTRIGTTQGIPLNDFGQTSVRFLQTQTIFTPKVGYRIVDQEHFKVDALVGLRYWHEGLTVTPRPANVNHYQSANWVDAVAGGKFEFDFSPKFWITGAGDAGGGQANLDYQAVGTLNVQPKPLFGFFAGWRYLVVNYTGSKGFLFDVAQSGPVVGLNMQLGGKPPAPPTASCSVSPMEIYPGDPVTATINPQYFNPKHTVTYTWNSSGGKVSGTGTTAILDTTGLAPGSYTVSGTATDPKEKKNNTASCNASFTVKAKPMNPPQASCSANPTTVKSGDPSTITASATSSDPGVTIFSYSYQATAGRISGTGRTATLDTTGAQSGPISVTVTATDSRGLTGQCTTMVGIENPPPPPACSKANSIQFPDVKRPWRVDNTAKAILDDVENRLKSDPNAKIAIIGYADGEKAPMVGTGKHRHPMNLAAQRAVNAKGYLVQQQGIDPSRVEVRQGTGQQQVADIIWLPQGANESACADLKNTTPVDESLVKPSENAYPKPRMAPQARHHAAKPAASTQQ